jgi:predicted nucleotidyltransferase
MSKDKLDLDIRLKNLRYKAEHRIRRSNILKRYRDVLLTPPFEPLAETHFQWVLNATIPVLKDWCESQLKEEDP